MKRLPHFAPDVEIIFIEGHSADGTYENACACKPPIPIATSRF